jgi:hypothetical protein
MSSINLSYKEGLEENKGKIIGFTKDGFAVIPNEWGCNALDTCECCGRVIHSQLTDADFCPRCAVALEIVSKEIAEEYCDTRLTKDLNALYGDENYKMHYGALIDGFKAGINFGVKNSHIVFDGIKINPQTRAKINPVDDAKNHI